MFDWLLGIQTALAEAGAVAPEAAAAAGEAPGTAAALIQMLLPMVLIVVVFYFMLIRPQRKKDKKVKDMLSNLKVGDRICTIGGIYGTITGLREDTIVLSVGGKDTPIVLARWAIRNVEAVTVENEGEILA
jgi:preprotein translocase subunit YajC